MTMSKCSLSVNDVAGMQGIAALADRLRSALTPGSHVELDLSATVDAHVSLLQLILAARSHASRVGADFRLSTPAPAPMIRTLERAGLVPRTPHDTAFWLHGDTAQ